MRYLFHVVSNTGSSRVNHKAHSTYEEARAHALSVYRFADLDTSVEITSGGLTMWGPYVVGGKYNPLTY